MVSATGSSGGQGSLYKKRTKVYPMQVTGKFRTLKWWIMAATLAIYYIVPWLRWDRGAGAPDQAVLIDFPGRRFYFFFIEIWPQEVYYITGLLIMAALGLFLATAVVGRAWCGYACPQTVWTDLFIAVERFIEGDRNARIRLDKASWSMEKIGKRLAKYAVWLVIGLFTGGAWVFYFADAPTLVSQLIHFEAPAAAVITIAVLTFTTFVLGGFAREQVCTYMCPWPRIQGAMMDEESLIVTYQDFRGEPRAPHKIGEDWEGRGDCVDCNRCVSVCPAGIDIRDGQQFACITCALCIDACDEIMAKVGRPSGLIAYDTLTNKNRRIAGLRPVFRFIRPRILVYGGLWALVGLIMLYALMTRADVELSVLHDRNPLFVALSDGSIRNGYTIKILNKSREDRIYSLAADGLEGSTISIIGEQAGESGSAAPSLPVERDRLRSYRVYVTLPKSSTITETRSFDFILSTGVDKTRTETTFRGPE
jgi:cytochrome c oxidase accessory protein FixG